MKHLQILILLFLLLPSCKKDDSRPLQANILADYIELNQNHLPDDIIACAAGKPNGLDGSGANPTAIFFYPIKGATDFKYFEAENIADSMDFSKYFEKTLTSEPIFNGYLWKFNNTEFDGERMGVVTYKTEGKLHSCTPIRQKTYLKPTEVNPALTTITSNGTNPVFTWEDGLLKENVIYFQVISDSEGNLISGTYTYDKQFTFYDLSNVVLNIANTNPPPVLEPNTSYHFTMMAVSEDNWVNLLVEKNFETGM